MSLTPEEQRLINKSLQVREQLVDKLLEKGIPADTEDRELLLKALDSSDKTILGKARLKLDEQANKNQAQMQDLVAAVLLKANNKPKLPAVNPELPATIERTNKVEGDTTIGVVEDNYSDFMKRMQE